MTDKRSEYMQKFYERHPDYSRNYYELHKEDYHKKYLTRRTTLRPCPGYTPEQRRALNRIRWRANRFLKYYGISRPTCQMCNGDNSQMHHPDYSNPFLVNFLCRKCHMLAEYQKVQIPDPIYIKDLIKT